MPEKHVPADSFLTFFPPSACQCIIVLSSLACIVLSLIGLFISVGGLYPNTNSVLRNIVRTWQGEKMRKRGGDCRAIAHNF